MTAVPPSARARRPRRDDPSLAAVAATELARLRRGFPAWFTVGLPFALVLPLGVIAVASPEGQAGQVWSTWFRVVVMFWGVLLPMAAALYASMAVRQDESARAVLYGYAVPRHRYLVGRFAALTVLGLAQAVLLLALLAPIGVALEGPHTVGPTALAVLVPWASASASVALCVLVAEVWGFAPAVCVGVAGMMFGALLADKSVWWAVPMGWPMTVVVPLAGIRANGVPLPPGDPLADTGVIPLAVALSLASTAVLLAIGARHVNRKEL
ncbi:hypothetical protein LG943_04530 [Streptomonospora sp. S1-112]|uniref:ABC-2 family transporter protein n=1 Tax=Streptomonospora mangrovi TaxID=2883123 RepID=A0A9X3NH36_9ACTN|nr:hypothetical protein [Streptomonospora mangrovi]MDA0563599.1 hypothetical protein [Streptomonospora mangrovi]